MKHDIDIKITKNSEEKINEFSAQDYLDKYVKLDTPNPDSSGSADESCCKKIEGWLLTNIFSMYLIFLYVIVGVNFASDQGWLGLKEIKHQTNVLAVLLVIFLIIRNLFKKKK
ncbi:hypothetical protein [Streptococcus anginosus]|uniref:hypothetical protein n=1 Tax=Streptococcus anginosus TaxID=1328 RepID=UPI0022DFE245|nr:hypothetical protein [Streptococcus anginosus]